ncbi:hypothetical protein [Neisseria sp.]|uniref:hypothetical protein n=1 Tax=Neisseria sp. TaxID=192066 RepID=UPI00359F1BFD
MRYLGGLESGQTVWGGRSFQTACPVCVVFGAGLSVLRTFRRPCGGWQVASCWVMMRFLCAFRGMVRCGAA